MPTGAGCERMSSRSMTAPKSALGPAPDEHAVGMGFQVNRGMDSGKPSVKASKTPGSAGRLFIGKASTAQYLGRVD